MTSEHRQHPLGTRFSPASSATDVLRGVDLRGRNIVVTGGHSGLGLETVRALSAAGATITVAARDAKRAAAAVRGIDRVDVSVLDLLAPDSIDSFVARWLNAGRPLHVLINCAGLPAPGERMTDARGYEAQFATNHLGHFQLTNGLLPALRAAHGARIVNVTSGAQRFSDIHWEDPHFESGYDPNIAYAQSKTANVLFTVEADHRWASDEIRSYAVHPGVVVGTGLNSAAGEEQLRAMGLIDESGRAIIAPETGRKTPQQGAATIVFAATSPQLNDIGGVYLRDCDVSPLDPEPRTLTTDPEQRIPADIAPHAIDRQSAQRLWAMSEKMLAA